MKLESLAVVLLVAAFLGVTTAYSAGEPAAKPAAGQEAGATQEAAWIKKAVIGGMAEVEMGRLAQEKARNPEVRKFGKHMVEDHSKVNDELMIIAEKKGVTPPSQLDAKHMAKKKELMEAKGADFDKKYMESQVQGHREMIAFFEQGAKNNKGEIKKFASGKLPALKKHLKMAQSVHTQVARK